MNANRKYEKAIIAQNIDILTIIDNNHIIDDDDHQWFLALEKPKNTKM